MYVIKRRDRHEYFYGFDNHYDPPKVQTSRIRKRLSYYVTFEETLPIIRKLGNGWEVVQLRAVKLSE